MLHTFWDGRKKNILKLLHFISNIQSIFFCDKHFIFFSLSIDHPFTFILCRIHEKKKLSFLNVTIYKRPPFFTRIVTVQLMKMMCDVYCFKPEVVCGRERKRMRKNKTKKRRSQDVSVSWSQLRSNYDDQSVIFFFSFFFLFDCCQKRKRW